MYYTSSDFISISEARKNFSSIIKKLPKEKHKLIIKNNEPTAVLLDFKEYEKMQKKLQKLDNEYEIVTDDEIVDTINAINGTNSNSVIFG